jgi:sigma-B regulation protein RsbU (phosphoserine phosphatase)
MRLRGDAVIKLFIIHGIGEGECFELEGDTVHIGRSPNNDLQIDEGSISRRHLKILKKRDKYLIQDMNSTNGTFVNNKLISPGIEVEIEEGLPIAIGKVLLSLGKPFSGQIEDIQDWVDFSKDLIETGRVLLKDKTVTIKKDVELFHKVSDFLKQSLDTDRLLGEILNCIFDYFKTLDRGLILLLDPETHKVMDIVCRFRESKEDTVMMYSRTIVNRVVGEGTAILMSDTRYEDEVNLSESMKLMQLKSVMCIPLISGSHIRGVIYVDSINKPVGFRKEDLFLLNALSSPIGLAIENASLRARLGSV